MADNIVLNLGSGGDTVALLDVGGVKHEKVIMEFLIGGVPAMVDSTNRLPVNTGLTPLTDTELRATPVAVSGIFFQATQPVSIAATIITKETRSTTGTPSSVSVTNSNTNLLASNANRLGATFQNEGTAACLLKMGATATTSSYSVSIASGSYYELPFHYTGIIDAITASGTAQMRITELT